MPFVSSLIGILSEDPAVRMMQGLLLLLGIVIVFLLLYATRDIILRTHSFVYQIVCILLVALLPVVGFLLYLLIRPARTMKEREMEAKMKMIEELFVSPSIENEEEMTDGEGLRTKDKGQGMDDESMPTSLVPSPLSSQREDEGQTDHAS